MLRTVWIMPRKPAFPKEVPSFRSLDLKNNPNILFSYSLAHMPIEWHLLDVEQEHLYDFPKKVVQPQAMYPSRESISCKGQLPLVGAERSIWYKHAELVEFLVSKEGEYHFKLTQLIGSWFSYIFMFWTVTRRVKLAHYLSTFQSYNLDSPALLQLNCWSTPSLVISRLLQPEKTWGYERILGKNSKEHSDSSSPWVKLWSNQQGPKRCATKKNKNTLPTIYRNYNK